MKTTKLTIDQLKSDSSVMEVDLLTTQITGGYIYYYTDANGNDYVSFDGGTSWYSTDLGYDWDWSEMVAYPGSGGGGAGGSTPGGTGTGDGSGNASGTGTSSDPGGANGNASGTPGGNGNSTGSTGTGGTTGTPGSGGSPGGSPGGTPGTGGTGGTGGGDDPNSSGTTGGYPGGGPSGGGNGSSGTGTGTSGTGSGSPASAAMLGMTIGEVEGGLIGLFEAAGYAEAVADVIAAVLAPEALAIIGLGIILYEYYQNGQTYYANTGVPSPVGGNNPNIDPNGNNLPESTGLALGLLAAEIAIIQLWNTIIAPLLGEPPLAPGEPIPQGVPHPAPAPQPPGYYPIDPNTGLPIYPTTTFTF